MEFFTLRVLRVLDSCFSFIEVWSSQTAYFKTSTVRWVEKHHPPKITNPEGAAELTDKQLDLINELLRPDERDVLTAWNRSKMTCYFGPTETVPFFAGFETVLFIPEATDEEIKSILNADHSPSSTAGGTTKSHSASKIGFMIKALKEKRGDPSPICRLCWQPGHQQKACKNEQTSFPEDELLGAEMKNPRQRE